MTVLGVAPPRGAPYDPIDTIEALQEHLQWAVMVEFATIPPYLTALYSLEDRTSDAYQLIRSVALEEMLHFNLASNLLNAIGASPRIVAALPTYPTYIAHWASGGPFVQLMAASPELMSETFMAIELPAPLTAPAEGDNFATIGQLYKAIEEGFETCIERFGAANVFRDTGFQRVDYDFGNSGGQAVLVHDLASAKLAITEIVEQGEGAETGLDPYVPTEPWGAYEHYGLRTDGTYGPILGTPLELSHYFKFKAIATGVTPLPAVYPMAPNPSVDRFENPLACDVATIFNGCYGILVRGTEMAFSSNPPTDPFFTVVVPMMQSVLPVLATQLMQIPVLSQSDATLGPTAGPPFAYRDAPVAEVAAEVSALIDSLSERAHSDTGLASLVAALQTVLGALQQVHESASGLTV